MDYDLIVIGGGPGGYVAAIRAAQLGIAVALVERAEVGGVCLNRGCIPTKTLISASNKLAALREGAAYGITVEGVQIDFAKLMRKKKDVTTRLRNGVQFLLRKNGVKLYRAEAHFLDAHTVQAGGETLRANTFILASGAVPRPLPFASDSPAVIDSDALLQIDRIPSHLVIMGGGVIGVEFAGVFRELGSEITIVEMAERILPGLDHDLSAAMHKQLAQKGVQIHTATRVLDIAGEAPVQVRICNADGQESVVEGELVLNSTGRIADFASLELANAGVHTENRGIPVDEHFATNVPHIYAIGDVLGRVQLAHLASAQALHVVEALFGQGETPTNLDLVPACVYSSPEIASVGLSEAAAQAANIHYQKAVFPMAACGKALAMNEADGFVKLLHDGDKLLGVHILAPHATDIIAEAAVAMAAELGLQGIASVIHPHPTISEALMEAAHLAEGKPIHVLQ